MLLVAGGALLCWLFRSSPSPAPEHPRQPLPKGGFQQRIVAIGDLHGDMANAKKVLRMAGIVDANAAWIGGSDVLVQTGDIVDRGTYAVDIYWMMRRLRSEAHSAGGRVVSILGNHEMMNAVSDWRYVTASDISYWGGVAARQADMSSEGWLGQEWLANYSVTAHVALAPHAGAPSLSFTHGGLRPSYPFLSPYPDAINELGVSLLKRAITPPLALPFPPNPYEGLPEGTTRAEATIFAGDGPLWSRALAEGTNEQTVCRWAKELQDKLGVRRLIMGHTPTLDRIVSRCNASVIIIDTGIGSAYGGILSALEIIYTLTPVGGASGAVANSSDVPEIASQHQPPPNTTSDDVVSKDPTTTMASGQYHEREEVYAIYERGKQLLALETRTVAL